MLKLQSAIEGFKSAVAFEELVEAIMAFMMDSEELVVIAEAQVLINARYAFDQ